MELGLHFTELTCCEQTGRLVMSHEETMETAIAEYCPDMTRIVSVCGQLQIRERTALEGRVTATGTVRVTVLYTSEESVGLRSLTLPVPFSCTAEDETLASSQLLWATGRLLLAEAQAVTARKLYVRVLPEVTLTGYTRAQCRFCSGTEEDPALRVRRRDHDISLLDTAAERSFSVAQETPEVSPAPEDLLLYRLCPRLTSCRLVGSKLVLKGELALSALYRGQDQQLHTYAAGIPDPGRRGSAGGGGAFRHPVPHRRGGAGPALRQRRWVLHLGRTAAAAAGLPNGAVQLRGGPVQHSPAGAAASGDGGRTGGAALPLPAGGEHSASELRRQPPVLLYHRHGLHTCCRDGGGRSDGSAHHDTYPTAVSG